MAGIQTYGEVADAELIAAVCAGDDMAAVALLVDRCGPGLKYLVRRKFPMLRLHFDELVSEVYIALRRDDWKALRAFRGGSAETGACRLDTYISVIASRLLWKRMERAVKEIDWKAPPIEADILNVEQAAFEFSPRAAELADAIMALENPQDRALLQLYKLQGLSTEEVAERLGISPGNVYTRCSRALKNLRAALDEGGGHA